MFYKNIEEDYIVSISTRNGLVQIPESEYLLIKKAIDERPTAPDGYYYRLKTDMTWELAELPPIPEEEAAVEDYSEQLERFGVE